MPVTISINIPFPSINIDLTPKPVKPPRAPSLADIRAGRGMLARGMEGASVTELQQRLGVPQTGKFDADTDRAVRGFQKKFGLMVDGVVGRRTLDLLDRKNPGVMLNPVKPAPVVLAPPPPPAAPVVAPLAPPPPAMGEIR